MIMNSRIRIKICGITDPHEAAEIAALGVDALGFIFVKESPRYIEPELARRIIGSLPPFVDAVGVFMNEDPDHINDMVHYCKLTLVQLHGSEPAEYCETINSRIIKAFRVKEGMKPTAFAPFSGLVSGFLLDTYRKGQAGGTGETFDWEMVEGLGVPGPVVLAGGLGLDNIADAVNRVRPFAVDVNSGVEFKPGRKDLDKVRELVRLVRSIT